MTLKEARRFRGISQGDIAQLLNITQGAVSHWEMSINTVPKKYRKQLERVLGCPIDFDSYSIQMKRGSKTKRAVCRHCGESL